LWIILVPSFGYLFSYLSNVAATSARGSDANPGWPEFIHVGDDIVRPFFHGSCLLAACLGPGVAAAYWVHFQAGTALVFLGLFFLPMALLTVSLADSIRGLNPTLLVSAIGKAPGAYLLAGLTFLAVLGVSGGLKYEGSLLKIPFLRFLPSLVLYFVLLYGLVWVMRIMGLFYRTYRDRFIEAV
jgi:uncharacterized membrane protein